MRFRICLVLLLSVWSCIVVAQTCPVNIGFESGTFANWRCWAGTDQNGNLQITETGPLPGRHTIIQNTSPQPIDGIGDFPMTTPNGSKYSLILGNSGTGAEIEQVTYDLKIPAGNNHFTLTYYYAVVLQNPNHADFEQPAFTAAIDDITTGAPVQNVYRASLDCGNHQFVASAGLQGFHDAGGASRIQYKEWSPVNVSLIGYAGRTLRLSFTTRDCTKGGHFGYAYLDFEENCQSPISGGNYCLNASSVTLTAPPGFKSYMWFDASFKDTLGTDYTLEIKPPVDNKKYALVVQPYPGLGCTDTLYTTTHAINEVFNFNVQNTAVKGCKSDGVDLTSPAITAGSSDHLKYEYYTDAKGQNYLADPKLVTKAGIYYIRGTNAYGCTDIKPVAVELYDGPQLTVAPPVAVCKPATINLKAMATTADPGAVITFYKDARLTQPVANPTAINVTGAYFIKATSALVPCTTVTAVNLVVSDLPVATPLALEGCPPLNLNTAISLKDPDNISGNTYDFFKDAAGTQPLDSPTAVTKTGIYYYRPKNVYGCVGNISSIAVKAYPVPVFKVTDPEPVMFPQTVSLADTHIPLTYAEFTYWKDAALKVPLDNYRAIGESGTYYVKAINSSGCVDVHALHVLINAPPEANLVANNTFTPNGDGINDEFRPTTKGVLKVRYLKIFNRYGQQVFETRELLDRWTGAEGGKQQPAGTYYWVFGCYDIYRSKEYVRSGSVTLIR